MKRVRVANRKRFISAVSMIIFLVTLACSAIVTKIEASAEAPSYWIEKTVHEGDTLWDLAEPVVDESQDIRCVIDTIMTYNHLESADIYPGQSIWIPGASETLVAQGE